jgi:hypothetical protein
VRCWKTNFEQKIKKLAFLWQDFWRILWVLQKVNRSWNVCSYFKYTCSHNKHCDFLYLISLQSHAAEIISYWKALEMTAICSGSWIIFACFSLNVYHIETVSSNRKFCIMVFIHFCTVSHFWDKNSIWSTLKLIIILIFPLKFNMIQHIKQFFLFLVLCGSASHPHFLCTYYHILAVIVAVHMKHTEYKTSKNGFLNMVLI